MRLRMKLPGLGCGTVVADKFAARLSVMLALMDDSVASLWVRFPLAS